MKTTKPKHKFTWLDRSVILSPYFCLCLSEKEYNQALDHIDFKGEREPWVLEDKDASVHFLRNGRKSIRIVCLQDIPEMPLPSVYALLVHEAVHIWQDLCKDLNESDPGREIEAYSIQHLSQQLINEFMRRKRIKRSRG